MEKIKNLSYEVGGRYGYHAIDLYGDFKFQGKNCHHGCIMTIICGLTRKQAESMAYYLNEAYESGKAEIKK